MNKKIITELTDEELLKIINKAPETEQLYFRNDVTDFISFYNIKSGKYKISTKLLYKLYVKWSENPISLIVFTKTLTDLFTYKMSGPNYFILLNKTSFKLKSILDSQYKVVNKTKQKSYKKHFDLYLEKYNITKGTTYITNKILYNLYDKWT